MSKGEILNSVKQWFQPSKQHGILKIVLSCWKVRFRRLTSEVSPHREGQKERQKFPAYCEGDFVLSVRAGDHSSLGWTCCKPIYNAYAGSRKVTLSVAFPPLPPSPTSWPGSKSLAYFPKEMMKDREHQKSTQSWYIIFTRGK